MLRQLIRRVITQESCGKYRQVSLLSFLIWSTNNMKCPDTRLLSGQTCLHLYHAHNQRTFSHHAHYTCLGSIFVRINIKKLLTAAFEFTHPKYEITNYISPKLQLRNAVKVDRKESLSIYNANISTEL